jgi:cysteine desulfurase / selenocysteine lyase
MKNLQADFPILKEKVNGHQLIYFDNAATSQRPRQVVDKIAEFYLKYNSNIHRSVHAFSEQATGMYEEARQKIAEFINARDASEIIFTRGTTEGINFVASTWGRDSIKAGDEILVTEMEHHANMVPWQELARRAGAQLKFIPLLPTGMLDMDQLPKLLTSKTKLVSVTHASNVLGTHVNVEMITQEAHRVGARMCIDAAQSIPHQKIDVQSIGCDFMAFSGHKMLGPTGVGVLYIRKELHDEIPPYQFGGSMVFEVDFDKATWQSAPNKFEAGTPAIAQVIGLGAAVDYYNEKIDFTEIAAHGAALTKRAIEGLLAMKKVKILGPIEELKKSGHLVTFVVDGMHSHDVAAYLSNFGLCTRAGHHCAQPLAKKLGVLSSVRASFMFYNTEQEVDAFLAMMRDMKL